MTDSDSDIRHCLPLMSCVPGVDVLGTDPQVESCHDAVEQLDRTILLRNLKHRVNEPGRYDKSLGVDLEATGKGLDRDGADGPVANSDISDRIKA